MNMLFLHNKGHEDGPFYMSQLRAMWQAGGIAADASIREHNTDWQPIATIAEQLDKPAPPESNPEEQSPLVCPHCQTRGQVRTRKVKLKNGISDTKAIDAYVTGGFSILFTGLSREEDATEATCLNCNSRWHF